MKATRPLLPAVYAALSACAVLCLLQCVVQASTPQVNSNAAQATASEASTVRYAVQINPGPETPMVLTSALSHNGEIVPVACATCHNTRPPDLGNRSAQQLDQFHQGLAYKHGEQSCLSCHNAGNYDLLKKADGTAVPFPSVMELCAQCHGPQFRDYKAGAHGGMNGYWDLSKGPRKRNTCTDCHDPHSPAYPKVSPVFAPTDRGALQQKKRAEQSHEGAQHD